MFSCSSKLSRQLHTQDVYFFPQCRVEEHLDVSELAVVVYAADWDPTAAHLLDDLQAEDLDLVHPSFPRLDRKNAC